MIFLWGETELPDYPSSIRRVVIFMLRPEPLGEVSKTDRGAHAGFVELLYTEDPLPGHTHDVVHVRNVTLGSSFTVEAESRADAFSLFTALAELQPKSWQLEYPPDSLRREVRSLISNADLWAARPWFLALG